ncbi:hypothetical protein [Brevibacillus sp. 179-C9.3 HS]|uniref:hypothetical protein n=1 Tax=unclassified Brevibacillus TaxID=2684853 RepID=UPI0039A30ED6
MFYHGIMWEYVTREYPVLSPRRTVRMRGKEQLLDRIHLFQQFGLEPVHLLEADEHYHAARCIQECLAFGDTVFAFDRIPFPMWQLSKHEIGVEVLDLRTCKAIYTIRHETKVEEYFPGIPCFHDLVPMKFS